MIQGVDTIYNRRITAAVLPCDGVRKEGRREDESQWRSPQFFTRRKPKERVV
jgi:hypothetical protein